MGAGWQGAKAGYAGHEGAWRGAIRLHGRVVWTCPHLHHNRDESSWWHGQAARPCARYVLALVEDPEGAHRSAMRGYLSVARLHMGDVGDFEEACRLADEVLAGAMKEGER